MRIGMKNRVCFKIVYVKKLIALFLIFLILGICLCGGFTSFYKPYITEIARSKANNLIQQTVNETVLEITKSEEYSNFVDIIRDSENRITGIETNAIKINKFKSVFLKEIARKFKEISVEKYHISLFSFLNNPFLSETGPFVTIKVNPLSVINAEMVNNFASVGVNQTKHEIDLKCTVDIVIVMPAIKIKHSVTSVLPVAQTVIVGQVPQSYTNVSTDEENLNDTVLQLAEN